MQRTNIYLEEDQTRILEELATHEGISRAELIRRLLWRALATPGRDTATDLAAIRSSFGQLRDVEAVSRGDGERKRHLAAMWNLEP